MNAPLVILLQGPVGPFFSSLAKYLRHNGFRVLKINFNAGDALQARRPGTFMFRDSPERWRHWFHAFVAGQQPKYVILFGDQRIYHRIAVEVCRDLGVDVWCFEEGYLRPDYITFERGGNSAASELARPDALAPPDAGAPDDPTPVRGNAFFVMARAAVLYYVVKSLGAFYLDNYVHHRSRPIASEAFFWARNFYRKWRRKLRNAHGVIDLLEHHHGKFFVVALQVYDDLNLVRHGRGWSNELLIEETIRSFAAHADPDDLLVIKCHPLDRGHGSYDAIVGELAAIAGIPDRVRLIDDAPLGVLIRQARGMVNINSTSGILGIRLGCPVFVLGDALYRHHGLAQFGEIDDLDRFWTAPSPPDADLAARFFDRMVRQTQINGSLYQKEYFPATFAAVLSRMTNARAPDGASSQIASTPEVSPAPRATPNDRNLGV